METECIIAVGAKHRNGYVWLGRKLAHRVAWEDASEASLLPGTVVMHLCDNRKCINPKHLRAASQKENLQDAKDKGRLPQSVKQLACTRGHDIGPFGDFYLTKYGQRLCRPCQRERSAKNHQKRKQT